MPARRQLITLAMVFWMHGFARVAGAQVTASATQEEGLQALDDLAAQYGGVRAALVRMSTRAEHDRGTTVRVELRAVSSDGRFAARDLVAHGPPGRVISPIEGDFKHFVIFDGTRLYASRQGGASHENVTPGDAFLASPGPIQHFAVPWPMVSRWARWLLGAADLRVERQGDDWTATSAALRLTLRWRESGELLATRMVLPQDGASVEYEWFDFDLSHAVPLPASATRRSVVRRPGADRASTIEEVYVIESVSLDVAAAEEFLSPADILAATNVYEGTTGDVYAPSGELLYNEQEFIRQFDEQYFGTAGRRRWLLGVVAVLVGVSVLVGIWRWRRAART